MTAELAIAVPAVLVVLAACLGGLRLGVERIRLTDAAAQVARAAAREEPAGAGAAERMGAAVTGIRREGDLVCASVRVSVPLLGVAVPLTASSCALAAVVP
ncbi:TadE family type IV pilus minor pilin [Amnibacterium endophyticum]|uniref:TadE family type IV pilus minor pilin n=1 Tax=Amnibacterium endophyticum TaxID=2109337 RepID=A0ABW4LD90_9MICO